MARRLVAFCIRGTQYWVDISVKSMSPLIDPGDVIALKKVEDFTVNTLYGEVYALVPEQYRTVKRIRKSLGRMDPPSTGKPGL